MTLAVGKSSLRGMARKLRVEYPGAIYHLMNRGDRVSLFSRMMRIEQDSWARSGRLVGRPGGKCMHIA